MLAKRWIYWKRRYSNPLPRDWVLLFCLLGVIIAAGLTFIEFRLGAFVLALVPAGLAFMRAMPAPWSEYWVNRSRPVDIATMLIFSGLLVAVSLVVPETH